LNVTLCLVNIAYGSVIADLFCQKGDEGIFRQMSIKLPLVFSIVAVVFKGRADLIAENLALRHQLSCLGDRKSRPRLRRVDRVFWVLLSRFWCGWRESLTMVKPATVLAWHRKGFKLFWRWKSRKRGSIE